MGQIRRTQDLPERDKLVLARAWWVRSRQGPAEQAGLFIFQ